MGKVVKMALPLAIGALVPIALPGVSAVITGAISGGLTSLVTGGNPILGAVTGGLGGLASQAISSSGGLDGLFGGPGTGLNAGDMFGTGAPSAAQSAGSASVFSDPGGHYNLAGGASSIAPASVAALSPQNLAGPVGSAFSDPGGHYNSFSDPGGYAFSGSGFNPNIRNPDLADAGGIINPGSSGSIEDYTYSDPGYNNLAGSGPSNVFDEVSGLVKEYPNVAKAGLKLLGGALSEEDPSVGGGADLAARDAGAVQAALDTNQAQVDLRNRAAGQIMGYAESFDPEGAGRRAAESRLLAGSRRSSQVDDTDRRRQAISRDIETDAASQVAAAYSGARESAQRQQLAGLSAGAGLIPAGLQASRGFTGASDIQGVNADRSRTNAQDIAGLFSPFFGSDDLREARP